ncbi:hypothetical protein FB45DRAFT_864272 [Roridomyces roridus]|uniref:Uncharacterized protein n=1 Tax=Roridomyces roridus TaxID=1738132 RepID=A0AAD7FS06_9AGAR|nr:hypothetical protein FB45DRAFT_864272 [Roridomyces roridus]
MPRFSLQLTLTEDEEYNWVDDLCANLSRFEDPDPTHVSVFRPFDILDEDEYMEVVSAMEEFAAEMQSFVLEESGVHRDNDWVGISLADEDAPDRDQFVEIVEGLQDVSMCIL